MSTNICSQCTNPYTRNMYIDNFNQIKAYRSQFEDIKYAINVMKKSALHKNSKLICIHRKVQSILDDFNHQITDYKKIADYHENITSLKQLDELEARLIVSEYNLRKLKKYPSKITLIKKAIRKIPNDIERGNALEIIKEFNSQIASYKRMTYYKENISNENQLRELEQRLDELGFGSPKHVVISSYNHK